MKYVDIKTPKFDMIYCKVKNIFGFQLYKWQVSVILDILKGVNIVVYINTSLGKSLPFQPIFIVEIRVIIFIVSLMVALIEDQIDNLLILLLSYPISNNVLVLHNAKKRDQCYCTNF